METIPLSGAQVKAKFRRNGITLADFARKHGYEKEYVYRVVNGVIKGRNGRGHEIMVKLGMKVPEGEVA